MNREEPGSARNSSRLGPLLSADGWVLFLASLLSRLYLGVLLCLALVAVLPALLGWHGTVVQSGSMEPLISPGDVVLAASFDSSHKVPVGGVVEFTSPAEAEPSGVEKTRLHRIVAENSDGTFVTAGDANAEPDSSPLKREQITGQARLLVPLVGLPGLWLGLGNFPALAWWSVLTLLAVVLAVFGLRPPNDGEETGESPDSAGDTPDDSPDGGAEEPDSEGSEISELAGSGAAEGPTAPPPPRARARHLKASTAVGLVAALTVLVVASSTTFSSAAFTATTANTGSTFATAADWTPPSVTLANPGTTIRASVALTAVASDAEAGVRNVTIQYLPSGGTWTTLCTRVVEPYSCTWNTQTVPDGVYSLRAIATDNSGLSTTSATIQTTVTNAFAVLFNSPGDTVRGNVNLGVTLNSPGNAIYTVRVEYSVAGANKWNTLCLNLLSPYQCTWATSLFANDFYDLRAVAVSGSTSTYSDTVADVQVDNLAPTVTMSDPGSPLRGVSTFTAVAADADSGVNNVQIQYLRTGTSTWATLCTVTEAPYSCRFDTTALATASYNFRAIATDEAGNSTTSAQVTNKLVDNTVSSVSMEDPGAYLSGNATLTAAANSTAGVTNVRIQSSPASTNTWTTRCTLAATPYVCAWDTRTVADGLYDFRAVLTDGAGKETISTVVTGRRVDNSPLRAADVQAANGTGALGKFDAGDTLTFTYSQQVNLASVSPGWAGAALPVTVRLRDGNVSGLGTGNNGDTVDVQRPGSSVNLGSVNTKGNFAKNKKTVSFNATMTATTVTVGGLPRTVVTVTLAAPASGAGSLRTSTTSPAMVWTPTSSVSSTSAVPCSLAPITESGTLDRDF
ncbi:signal peptidase I [Arthrobacter alpinus]|uniref:Signal peptidase I n=1 Tax=Arthrobacter alpinus TaxID=656366 RepID=A0A1H5M7H3_9MICC|nr:signal peptidase I [Arthrobacter alpinus]SEE85184.1 signal peptidase I [Arthrobacter alpinus]